MRVRVTVRARVRIKVRVRVGLGRVRFLDLGEQHTSSVHIFRRDLLHQILAKVNRPSVVIETILIEEFRKLSLHAFSDLLDHLHAVDERLDLGVRVRGLEDLNIKGVGGVESTRSFALCWD